MNTLNRNKIINNAIRNEIGDISYENNPMFKIHQILITSEDRKEFLEAIKFWTLKNTYIYSDKQLLETAIYVLFGELDWDLDKVINAEMIIESYIEIIVQKKLIEASKELKVVLLKMFK